MRAEDALHPINGRLHSRRSTLELVRRTDGDSGQRALEGGKAGGSGTAAIWMTVVVVGGR